MACPVRRPVLLADSVVVRIVLGKNPLIIVSNKTPLITRYKF